jgi:4-amino-4-deoxy-L-arabinose transferase-like glycosyltransferase
VAIPAGRTRSNTVVWLLAILAAGLVLRLALLPYRWINPDEGAHLMDGQLILHGLVPVVDFAARQPFYAYLQAGMLELFGGSYLGARLLPVAAIMGSAFLVFLIARRLFNPQVALLATAIYTFDPLVVIWSPVVKTEPLTTLLSALGLYCVVRFVQSEDRWRWLVLAGIALGLAYYVRESSLAVILAVAVFLLATCWRRPTRLALAWGALAVGGLLVGGLVMIFFARYMTAEQLWYSRLNPLHFVISAAGTLELPRSTAPQPSAGPGTVGVVERLMLQSVQVTLRSVIEVIRVNAFLFTGLVLSLAVVAYLRVRRLPRIERVGQPLLLMYCWAFALMLAYGYWAIHRGYFTQYFNETVPPLAIILAFVICYFARVLAPAAANRWPALVSGVLLAGIFMAHRLYPALEVPHLVVVLIPALLLALFYLPPYRLPTSRSRWVVVFVVGIAVDHGAEAGMLWTTRWAALAKLGLTTAALAAITMLVRGRAIDRAAFAGLVLIGAASIFGVGAAGRVMSVAYDCVWSPATVATATRDIQALTIPGDEVMSGAVIWAVAANRPPFMRISHPLAYDGGAPPEEAARLRAYLHATPPRLIILDGYTDRTFLSYLDPGGVFLANRYELRNVLGGSRHPVKIYALKASSLSAR